MRRSSKLLEMRENGYMRIAEKLAGEGCSLSEISRYIKDDTDIDPSFTVSPATLRKSPRLRRALGDHTGIEMGKRPDAECLELSYVQHLDSHRNLLILNRKRGWSYGELAEGIQEIEQSDLYNGMVIDPDWTDIHFYFKVRGDPLKLISSEILMAYRDGIAEQLEKGYTVEDISMGIDVHIEKKLARESVKKQMIRFAMEDWGLAELPRGRRTRGRRIEAHSLPRSIGGRKPGAP